MGFLLFPTHANDQLEKITDEICQCLETPYQQVGEALIEMINAQDSKDLSKVTQSQNLVMELIVASRLCIETYRHLYPELAQDIKLEENALSLLDQKCPDPLLVHRTQSESLLLEKDRTN